MEGIETLATFELQGISTLFHCIKIKIIMQQDENLELFS